MRNAEWPPLPYDAWEETRDTLHMWTQIVGKTRLALAPPRNHWWNVPFYVTPRELSTSPVPLGGHRVFEAAGFVGKSSPVHFFWGSFDLAVTRFSGRRAPPRPGADRITREAYSHEVISVGFWPGDRRHRSASFYAYAAPVPAGLDSERVAPPGRWSPELNEFLLDYEEARSSPSPDRTVLAFLTTAYEAAARRAGWDRQALERSA